MNMTLGEKLSTQRKNNNMTQEQLAALLGVSRQAISKWESDTAFPETEKLIKMAEFFQCSLDYLLKDSMETDDFYQKAGQTEQYIRIKGFKGFKEKKSDKIVFGMPLWHVGKKAHGFIAIGINAKGVIAIGMKAQGIISIGMLSNGLLSLGMLSFGLLALGMIAIGAVAGGSIAVGILSFGAISLGVFSLGAVAVGDFSVGALAVGKYAALGDHAQGMIALGDTKATGSLFEYLGDFGMTEIVKVKDLLNQNVPEYLKWAKNLFTCFL